MDLRFLAGGLLSGVGQGIAMQGQQDILDRREQALATLRSATQQQLETQKETAASKRDAAKLASDKELQTQKDTAAGEREKTKVAGKSQSDAAAMARTRVSAGATVEAAKLRTSSQGLLGSQFTDDQGNLWTVPKAGGPAQPVLDGSGNQLKGPSKGRQTKGAGKQFTDDQGNLWQPGDGGTAQPVLGPDGKQLKGHVGGTNGPAPELEKSRVLKNAILLNPKIDESGDPVLGPDQKPVPDWARVADTLDAQGFKAEAEAARKNVKMQPPPPAAPPAGPGLFQRAKDILGLGGETPPPTPAGGGDTATAAPAPTVPLHGQPIPRGSDGKVDTRQLVKDRAYKLPDGRQVQWDGTSFVVLP